MAAVPSGPSLDSTPHYTQIKKKNSLALARKWTIPTERPPLVGEVSVEAQYYETELVILYNILFVSFVTLFLY
jgi:hypothetical protein